ncbi:MAG TPA: DUF3987 domain-containing protein, partial [Isosphaeraceae bacterium]|nr:DUF3987 domain-containing protein [Isosphaeraceae bacterium]
MSEHGNGQPAVNGEATRAGAGRYSGPCPIRAATSGAEVAFVQWLCYHEDERDALRAVGLDADVIGDLNPDGRHLVIVTGAGDLYGVSKSLDDAQAAYGAGALTVRIVLVPTARGSTARHLLDANVIDRASLEGLAEAAEPIPDYHIEPWPELCLQEEPEALPFPVEVFSEPLRRFCLGVASVTLTPPDMAGCAMLAVASAAIGQSCQILVKRTWRESPLLFLLTVADPGKKKTPVLKLVGAPLSRIDAQLRNQSKDSRALWE